ncbi:hypothetical protein SAMN05216588_13325 [Pseudomonas flavescens]|uniref:Uncharacterized protein n=1 Tax=Phytopseudomonas flavescens TaxID=29435 RepID=A0A1G8Q6W6_9GAMM|nr:hypothetical protein [Pseudomonas flavescens]SDJ00549.1 hypothetical protein SAMN05216588_13325 [Pseudomonas flavescens]
MHWGLIFERQDIHSRFQQLRHPQKTVLVAAYLYRQLRLIEDFDHVYSERLSALFSSALSLIASEEKEALKDMADAIEAQIPDTEEFSEQQGSHAQNLMIALHYLIAYSLNAREPDLRQCVNMSLQNIDLLNHEKDENYDQAAVIGAEADVMSTLIGRMVQCSPGKQVGIDRLGDIVKGHWI